MSSNDFLEFDDDAQTQESSSGRNPFIILAGVLVTILVLASICTVYLYGQRGQDNGEQVAARLTENANIAVTNEAVAQTIAAMETENAQPATETVVPTSAIINTPTPTPTTSATDTPVVEVSAEATTEEGGETTGDGAATTGDADTEGEATTETNPSGEEGTTQEGTPAAAFDTTGSDSTLPQTGLDTWAAILLAIFFVGLLIASRRLRSG
jgi:cobalamin biosynthesis Mg chelatase CobN